jgi:hypothetical protein
LMASEDLTTNIAATRAFVHGCFSKQPTADDFEIMLSFNMMVPPKVRAGLGGRPHDATEIMSKLKAAGPGDAWRGRPQCQTRHREVHRLGHPGRQAFDL